MRSGGILLHITSLPSPGGIGTLGPEAYAFADFLHASGMKIWQVLPIGPTGYGNSPYQSTSAYAGNPLLISLDLLRKEKLLDYTDEELYMPDSPEKIDYDAVRANKEMLLRRSYSQSFQTCKNEILRFRQKNPWVDDFALFTALKAYFSSVKWTQWPDDSIRRRLPEAIEKYTCLLRQEIDYHIFCQYLFRKQWFALKEYCEKLSVSIFGDMPIYVAEDSSDTWTHPEVFQLDRNLIPKRIAGVPPDYFSADGQLWGNPLYRWRYLKGTGFSWWIDRMRAMSELYDIIRIDHFIGFANYYSVKYGSPNARKGKWIKAPGKALFQAMKASLPDLRIIAEDLGAVNARVRKLLDWCGYPGMKVLTFGFDSDESNPHYISHYEKNCVVYTGTHDNNTALGWAKSAADSALSFARKILHFEDVAEAPKAFVHAAFSSVCDTAVAPMQDILSLGEEARMNLPGSIGHNWEWRMNIGVLTTELSQELYNMNRQTGRL